MYLLDWNAAQRAGPEQAGGKGWNLGRLHRYGFAIPAGGVISAAAYTLFGANERLQPLVTACGGVGVNEIGSERSIAAMNQLREAIMGTPLPTAIAQEIEAYLGPAGLLDRPVAVRSSATAEDSAAASFAGMHSSYLNVTGLPAILEAVKGCYASLWRPQAVAYRRRLPLSDERVSAAVVILAMVPAQAAGISFSCDPRDGRRDQFAISASFGLGEAVVGGAVEPDEYRVDMAQYPPVVVNRRIGRKDRITVTLAEGGTALAAAPAAQSGRPALSDAQITELALLTGRVYDSLGEMEHPVDVEWAHDGEQFWLLQARPVTYLPPATFPATADQPVFWSNANLKDVMPGVQSTLGWSFMRQGIDVLITAPLRAAGSPYVGGMTWVRIFEGRAYFNLSAMQWAFHNAMGMAPAELNRMLGGHQPEVTLPPATLSQKAGWGLARFRLISGALRAMNRAKADFSRLWAWAHEMEQKPLATCSQEQLLNTALEIKERMDRNLGRFNMVNGASGGTHQELVRLLEPVLGERTNGLVNAMLAGVSGITSAEQGDRLVQLANQAQDEAAAREFFTAPEWQPATWSNRLADTQFGADFQRYLHDYGHRGVYELEPMNPRWREDPTYLLEMVRAQVQSGRRIHPQGRSVKREAATQEVFARIGWGPRRLQVRFILWVAAHANRLREFCKSVLVKIVGLSRIHALEVGRRMVDEGLLKSKEAVFHLSWLDMEAYLGRRSGLSGLPALVADRQERRVHHLRLDPPDVIMGETPVRKAPPPEAAGPVLTGLGVASGRAAGVGRVIRHPHEGGKLQMGDVLVAPSTDPAWTPLFLRASAVVMEVGGYLSHGAIVAREYGLPAVVNVPGLLQSVSDGEYLTVDGDVGKVYRQSKTESVNP